MWLKQHVEGLVHGKTILFIAIISALLVGYFTITSNSVTVEELLNQKDLIVVQPDYTYPYKIAFDLEKESFFTVDLA